MSHSTICTLCEGNYNFGLIALINSLIDFGYRGDIWVGYLTELPPWFISEEMQVKDCRIRFLKLSSQRHIVNLKPDFMLSVLSKIPSHIENLFFVDCDIVINKNWSVFENWIQNGITLCYDLNWNKPNSDPQRDHWRKFSKESGIESTQSIDYQVNSGFIGIKKEQSNLLTNWSILLNYFEKIGGDLTKFFIGKYNPPYIVFEQDLFNIALMTVNHKIAILNDIEGMGFRGNNSYMLHPAGLKKPWQISYLWEKFRGRQYNLDLHDKYLKHSQTHLKSYSNFIFQLKKIELFFAKIFN